MGLKKSQLAAALFAIIFGVTFASIQAKSLPKIVDNSECDCYSSDHLRLSGLSCHCRDKVHIRFDRFSATLTCDAATASDPYPYLTQTYIRSMHALTISGCPPPEKGYSSVIPTVPAENNGDMYVIDTLMLNCLGLNDFHLKSHHLQNLGHLMVLRISCPVLLNIPEDFLPSFSRIIDLVISKTALEYLPDQFFSSLTSVKMIVLQFNKLKTIPSLVNLTKLENLDISGNTIEYLKDDIFLPTKECNSISLRKNRLRELPNSLCELEKLRELDAADNRIQFLNLACLFNRNSISRFNLSGNILQSLLPQFSVGRTPIFLTDLRKTKAAAGVRGNKVSFPANSRAASNRTTRFGIQGRLRGAFFFQCTNNNLTTIPENIFSNKESLWTVNISFNRISSLPANLFCKNNNLRSLWLSNNLISYIPEVLFAENPRLEALDISSNKIQSLGDKVFARQAQLKHINLSNNYIEILPGRIFIPLKHALHLNLADNRLSSLPILDLPRLVHLNLKNNRLSDISHDTLRYLPALERIGISHNYITSDNVGSNECSLFQGNLRKLERIDLCHNRLTSIPHLAHVNGSLKSLNLSWNSIDKWSGKHVSNVKDIFMSLFTLQILDLSHNLLGPFPYDLPSEFNEWNSTVGGHVIQLDLSWNRISLTSCAEDTLMPKCDFFLEAIHTLEVLNLAHNEIEELPLYFTRLPNLRKADFSHNKIKTLSFDNLLYVNGVAQVSPGTEKYYVPKANFYELPNSHRLIVDLRNNSISHVDLPEIKMKNVSNRCHVESNFARATLLMGHNPITCSCRVFRLLQYSLKEMRPVGEEERWLGERLRLPATLDIQHLSCSEPSSVRGRKLSNPDTWMHHLLPLMGLCTLAGDYF